MTTGDWIAVGGDILVLVGLFVTLFIYLLQSAASDEQLRQSALAILRAARNGIDPWGKEHFTTDYSGQAAKDRSELDFNIVMTGGYVQNFRVPAEPLVAVIHQADEGRFIVRETIEAVNIAIWRIGQFNQIVQQQTDFNASHAAELKGELSDERQLAIAAASRRISEDIHGHTIGDASWYRDLIKALDDNIKIIADLGPTKWWRLRQASIATD